MTRYFSRIEVLRTALRDPRLRRELASGYGQHQLVWRALRGEDDGRTRDFVYRVESSEAVPRSALPRFYVVSARAPEGLDGKLRVDTKAYAPVLRVGDSLSFRLRANACRAVWHDQSESGRGQRTKRQDVVLYHKRKLRMRLEAGEIGQLPPMAEVVEAAGREWLDSQAQRHGFDVEHERLRIDGYCTHQLRKGGRRTITFSTLDFTGVIDVRDPDALLAALLKGLGHQKAFGCGLLMVRRGC